MITIRCTIGFPLMKLVKKKNQREFREFKYTITTIKVQWMGSTEWNRRKSQNYKIEHNESSNLNNMEKRS